MKSNDENDGTKAQASKSPAPRQMLCGLLVRKECLCFSWRGRFLVVLLVLLIGGPIFLHAHAFLAPTLRQDTETLVVEGWVHSFGVEAAVREFNLGHYKRVLTTGGPIEGMGSSNSIYNTDAYQSAALLRKAGIPDDMVQSVPSRFVGRDRTYSSAVTLRDWMQSNKLQIQSFNVLTEDAHARRTWMLFQKAFGKSAAVGIISVPNPDFDPTHWWRTSEGVREVIDESVAYLYAKLFFWPSA